MRSFRTMGIAVQRGRDFTSEDRAGSAPVAAIDERLARRFWPAYPNEDPVGQSILAGASPQPLRIVGVVSPVRQAGLAEEPEPGIYRPRSQTPPVSAMFAVRTEGDPKAVVASLRRELAKLDPNQAIADVKTLAEVVHDSEGRRRSISILLGSFAATALALAIIGLYGAIAQSVIRREREMGIRRALGAQGADVYRLVMTQGLQLTAMGLAVGIAGSLGVARVLESLLYRVSQPPVLAGVGVLFLGVAVAAALIPARRAARVDPASVLRLE